MKAFACIIIIFTNSAFCQSDSYNNEINEFRKQYKEDLLEESGIGFTKEELDDITFFPVNEKYKVNCKFKKNKEHQTVKFPTSSNTVKEFTPIGTLNFKIDNQKYNLTVYKSASGYLNPDYDDYLFIPFKDLTNNNETYGGGRYLDFWGIDLNSKPIVLDFNKAYNPYCAFSAGYSCPIPPKENHLNTEIFAGEKKYIGVYKK